MATATKAKPSLKIHPLEDRVVIMPSDEAESMRGGLYIPDTATAAAALTAGEADWYEQPPADLVPVFAANKDIVVATVDPLGNHGILRFNHVQPPFNKLKLRGAILNLLDQKDYMGAAAASLMKEASRQSELQGLLRPTCVAVGPAVGYNGWNDGMHTFVFLNRDFVQDFERENAAQIMS